MDVALVVGIWVAASAVVSVTLGAVVARAERSTPQAPPAAPVALPLQRASSEPTRRELARVL